MMKNFSNFKFEALVDNISIDLKTNSTNISFNSKVVPFAIKAIRQLDNEELRDYVTISKEEKRKDIGYYIKFSSEEEINNSIIENDKPVKIYIKTNIIDNEKFDFLLSKLAMQKRSR